MEKNQVPSVLKKQSVKALFEGIVAELVSCLPDKSDYRIKVLQEDSRPPAEKKRKVEPPENTLSSSLYSSRNREHLVAKIRTRLSEYLVSYYCHVRHQLIQRFLSSLTGSGWSADIILSFLDCLLDETFTKFHLSGKEDEKDKHPLALVDPVKFLKVFACRSPLIEKLKLCCGQPGRSVPFKPIIGQMLAVFKNLTHLSLDWKTTDRSCLLFFAALGDSCPKLITLELLGDLPFGIQQVLALVLGKKLQMLPLHFLEEVGGEDVLAELQFTPESLTPICNSLKTIKHNISNGCFNPIFCSSVASMAFILRHFGQLEIWEDSRQDFGILGTVIELLHQQFIAPSCSHNQQTMTETSGLIQWTMAVPFSRLLNLVKVGVINICSRKEMSALTTLCPNAKHITISGDAMHLPPGDLLSLRELGLFLSSNTTCWPKAETIFMGRVPAAYRQRLLSNTGGHLRKMKMHYCTNIDPIVELMPCTQLESLELNMSSLELRPTHCLIDANAKFLPSLVNLKTSVTCLGDWSSLFECPRPLLTNLSLSCSHIGIASKSPLFDWHNIPEMWPNLQSLTILSTLNLTLDKLQTILNLKKFETVVLPSKIFKQSVDEIGIEETMRKISRLLLGILPDGTTGGMRSGEIMFIGGPNIVLNCPFTFTN